MQPFIVVDDIGYKKFVNLLNLDYKISNRHVISNTLIPGVSTIFFNEVKEIKSNDLEMSCMTTDYWSSQKTIVIYQYNTNICTFYRFYLFIFFKSILLSYHLFDESHIRLRDQINISYNI